MAETNQQTQETQASGEGTVESPMKNAYDVLAYYQMELSVTKDGVNPRFNKPYATLSGINDALKPVQKKLMRTYGFMTAFWFKDDRIEIRNGERVRIVEPVLHTPFGNVEGHMEVFEGVTGGGLDPSQISGKASTYARKYAAMALFAIGDERDPDDDSKEYQEYPDGEFDATCRGCGQTYGGFTRENVESIQCPNCKTVGKWKPVNK